MIEYQIEYRRSLDDPESFWREQANSVAWSKKPSLILSKDTNGNDVWFADGELNTCYLAVDQHIEKGRGEQPALVYDSPVTGNKVSYTFIEVRDEVANLAGMQSSRDSSTMKA